MNPLLQLTLYAIDDEERLFISPALHEWGPVEEREITVVIDLEGGLDGCIPDRPDHVLYVYFPIFDEGLPDIAKLKAVACLGATMLEAGHKVLSHCGMGFNRSALVAGLILNHLGMKGSECVERIKRKRQGALFNEIFAEYLGSL